MPQTIAEYFIQQGAERGEKRGELRAKREAVLKLLQLRFDSIPPSMVKKIKSVRREDRLNGGSTQCSFRSGCNCQEHFGD